jgi:hypothetical protein
MKIRNVSGAECAIMIVIFMWAGYFDSHIHPRSLWPTVLGSLGVVALWGYGEYRIRQRDKKKE